MNNRNIVITGFMGTGKSTIGPLVAGMLKRPFIETDTEIERRAGLSIPQIFEQQGEVAFRQMERTLCEELSIQQRLVIATGGGTLIDDVNRTLMLKSSFVVCLTASLAILERRLSASSNRPLASEWRQRLEQREAIYRTLPHQVDTSNLSPHEIAQEIIHLWRKASQ